MVYRGQSLTAIKLTPPQSYPRPSLVHLPRCYVSAGGRWRVDRSVRLYYRIPLQNSHQYLLELFQLFLAERTRWLRGHVQRHKVWMFYTSMISTIVGFGAVGTFAFMDNKSVMSKIDGRWHIGLSLRITLPFLIYVTFFNDLLTIIFWISRCFETCSAGT